MVLEGICQDKYGEPKYTMENICDETQRKRRVLDQSRLEKEREDTDNHQ